MIPRARRYVADALFGDVVVATENLAPQGHWPDDLHQAKVHATAQLCRRMQPLLHIEAIPERFKRSTGRDRFQANEPVIFCCVDSIVTRRMIWETIRSSALFFVDGRMSAEVVRVLAVDQPAMDHDYAGTLFAAEQPYARACTARSTIYTASIAAGWMLHQFTKWLRGLPVDADVVLNLLAAELTVGAG